MPISVEHVVSYDLPDDGVSKQLYDLQFPTLGIPENAVILHVGCTANGGPAINCLPVEVSMSFWVPRFSGNKVQIYGFPTVNGEDDIEVWGSVTWVHNDNNSEPWRLFAVSLRRRGLT